MKVKIEFESEAETQEFLKLAYKYKFESIEEVEVILSSSLHDVIGSSFLSFLRRAKRRVVMLEKKKT